MIEQIILKKEVINQIGLLNQQIVTISNPVLVKKDLEGNLEIEVSGGQLVEKEMVDAIRLKQLGISAIKDIQEEEPVMLTENIGFHPSEDKGLYLLINSDSVILIFFIILIF